MKGIEYTVNRHRLIQFMKHLKRKSDKGKIIKITYHYDNSLDMSENRIYEGYIKDFNIKTIYCDDGKPYEYMVRMNYITCKKENRFMEEYIPADACFFGICKINWVNSGPYCYFVGEWEK